MNQLDQGFDVLIVTVNNRHQARFWEACLEAQRGKLIPTDSYLAVVVEKWPDGAGSGLGSLYAYQQARNHSRRYWGADLLDLQRQGAAIAIVHAAGQGKRIAPLSVVDYNNKSALKMPEVVQSADGSKRLLTLLEAVIRHLSLYAPFRKKRLSVFWGDQICLPQDDYKEVNHHHIMIAASMGETPDAAAWQSRGLNSYGVLLRDGIGNAQSLEKISYEIFEELLKSRKVKADGGVGVSFGSFSLSLAMIEALLEEFAEDLLLQKNRYDCEQHFWMPLTLCRDHYIQLTSQPKSKGDEQLKLYERMQKFKQAFTSAHGASALIGINDLGNKPHWWDFGTLSRYYSTLMQLIEQNEESNALRTFFSIPPEAFDTDKQVLKLESSIREADLQHSLLIGVTANRASLHDSIAVDVTAQEIDGQGVINYKVCEAGHLRLPPEGCCADLCLTHPQQNYRLYTNQNRDGKADWKERLPHNPFSYAECTLLSADVDLFEAEALWNKRKQQIKATLKSS